MPAETLLVVDDDADNRFVLSRRLETEGWVIRQAESGEVGRRGARRHRDRPHRHAEVAP